MGGIHLSSSPNPVSLPANREARVAAAEPAIVAKTTGSPSSTDVNAIIANPARASEYPLHGHGGSVFVPGVDGHGGSSSDALAGIDLSEPSPASPKPTWDEAKAAAKAALGKATEAYGRAIAEGKREISGAQGVVSAAEVDLTKAKNVLADADHSVNETSKAALAASNAVTDATEAVSVAQNAVLAATDRTSMRRAHQQRQKAQDVLQSAMKKMSSTQGALDAVIAKQKDAASALSHASDSLESATTKLRKVTDVVNSRIDDAQNQLKKANIEYSVFENGFGSAIATESNALEKRKSAIAQMFREILHREPDDKGLEFWANSGLSVFEISKRLSHSPEGLHPGNHR